MPQWLEKWLWIRRDMMVAGWHDVTGDYRDTRQVPKALYFCVI